MKTSILKIALALLLACNAGCKQKDQHKDNLLQADLQKTILFKNTMQYDKAKLKEFKASLKEGVAFAQANAPQLFVHVYLDEPNGLAYSYQLYRNSGDILKHWEVSENMINNVMQYSKVIKFEVYGEPSDTVIKGIEASVDKSIVSYYRELCGYNKFTTLEIHK